jgi:hypothetical protein
MKKLLAVLFVLAALALPSRAQNVGPQSDRGQRLDHKSSGIFSAPAYGTWQSRVLTGNSATGSGQSIVVLGPSPLADGYNIPPAVVFNTLVQVSVGAGAVAEFVTPTAVSVGACPPGTAGIPPSQLCATLTGTFNQLHGFAEPVVTGDSGIGEALTDAANQGGGLVWWQVDTGSVTLNTGGLTTTTTSLVPSNFLSEGASGIVKTTITTSANWAVGISGSTSAFCTANSTLTAGTNCIANLNAPARVGSTNTLVAVLFTMGTSNPGAGAIRAKVWGYTPVQGNN